MTRNHATVTMGALAAMLFAGTTEAASPPPRASTVEIWERGSGPLQGDAAPRARSQSLNLDQLPLVEVERTDAQYGGVRAFRGIALKAVIDLFAPDASLDLAILHFANGMAVPVSFRDAAVMKRLEPFIARAMETHRKGTIRVDSFPVIKKKGAATDVRPITFAGNKLVVAELWHPAVAVSAAKAFSPWAHVDTLASIELVTAPAYYRQFEVGDNSSVQRGFEIFRETCQFCHGVRKVGAKFGWDFVEREPIYKVRKPAKNLFYHMAYKPLDAAERGLMMPAMKFMTQTDAALLWQWLHAIATTPMQAYTAAPTKTGK